MSSPITNEALSIVREMVNLGTPSVVLPPHVVREIVARIDIQDRKIKAYGHLVNCHDNYLCRVDNTTEVIPQLLRLEEARARVEELDQ